MGSNIRSSAALNRYFEEFTQIPEDADGLYRVVEVKESSPIQWGPHNLTPKLIKYRGLDGFDYNNWFEIGNLNSLRDLVESEPETLFTFTTQMNAILHPLFFENRKIFTFDVEYIAMERNIPDGYVSRAYWMKKECPDITWSTALTFFMI